MSKGLILSWNIFLSLLPHTSLTATLVMTLYPRSNILF